MEALPKSAIAWAVASAVFLGMEFLALRDGDKGFPTLSQVIRHITESRGMRSVLVGVLAWLVVHLVWEGRSNG